MRHDVEQPVFTAIVKVHGSLLANFVFRDKAEALDWIKLNGPILEDKYGALSFHVGDLPGLKVGDKCNVWGEANEVFTITGIKRWEDHRWGFLIDGSFFEEVAKCHTEFLQEWPYDENEEEHDFAGDWHDK